LSADGGLTPSKKIFYRLIAHTTLLRQSASRIRSGLLLICLLAIATLLASVSSGLGSSLFLMGGTPPKGSQASPTTGTLLVRAMLAGNGTDETPLANVNVSVVDVEHPVRTIPFLDTNASGEVEIALSPAEYAVSIHNLQFSASAHAQIYADKTTELDAAVSRTPYPALFTEVADRESSGFQGPWTPVTVAISSPSATFRPNEQVFIDTIYLSDNGLASHDKVIAIPLPVQTQFETQATVISSDLRASGEGSVLWLTLQPADFIPVTGLLSVTLATYVANLQVSIHGP
jgi:hypothetical protein